MKFEFIGDKKVMERLKTKVGEEIEFVNRIDAQATIIEVNSADFLKSLPKRFLRPTFL